MAQVAPWAFEIPIRHYPCPMNLYKAGAVTGGIKAGGNVCNGSATCP